MPTFIKVKFIKAHPDYAYSAGQTGTIHIKKVYRLIKRDYVRIDSKAIIQAALEYLKKKLNQ